MPFGCSSLGFAGRVGRLAVLLLFALTLATACADDDAAPVAAPDAAGQAPSAATPAFEKTPELAAQVVRGVTGVILNASEHEISVRDLSEGSRAMGFVNLAGGPETRVTGLKQSFAALRKGDLVAVSFQGDPPKALGVLVLPLDVDPELKALAGGDPYVKRGREFMGWIKRVDDTTLVVRTPNGGPGSRRKGEVKTFARHDGTVVELLRSSWDELKKGDRVAVEFRKGEPRPADRVKVVLRGGEKPLPRGLATLLFDPEYDQTVQDVDGIGEWPPGKPWPASGEPARSD